MKVTVREEVVKSDVLIIGGGISGLQAAIAAGEFGNYEEACDKLVHMKDTIVTPNHENQKYYEEQFAIFRELYGHNADLFRL